MHQTLSSFADETQNEYTDGYLDDACLDDELDLGCEIPFEVVGDLAVTEDSYMPSHSICYLETDNYSSENGENLVTWVSVFLKAKKDDYH